MYLQAILDGECVNHLQETQEITAQQMSEQQLSLVQPPGGEIEASGDHSSLHNAIWCRGLLR